ncbi:MAG TPA: hypothetical protein VNN73_07590 [Blastocatellia bacterium]|nr:hypothetical protein [Blastocatellia bacterium]
MKRILVSSLAAIALLISAGSPLAQSIEAHTKRKPTMTRKSRITRARAVARPTYNEPAPAVVGPVYATYRLDQNQYFRLRMNQTISSGKSRMGDRFKATVITPVYADGVEVVPAGSIVEGRVTSAIPARSRGREGQLAVAFDTLVVPDGKKYSIDGVLTELQDDRHGEVDAENEVSGRSSDKRQIIYVGGGTAGGAILGGVIGGAKGAGIGAVLGAGAGVAGALLTKGNEAELRSGTEIGMVTTRPITFTIRSIR